MYLVLISLNLPKIVYNTSLITTKFQYQVKHPVLYKCITSVRISALFEKFPDPRVARWNRMHE